MVSWVIEQEQIRLFEEQFRQSDSHLPSAGELLGAARPVVFTETETGKHRPDLSLDCVAISGAELAIGTLEPIGYLVVLITSWIKLAHSGRQRLKFCLEFLHASEDA